MKEKQQFLTMLLKDDMISNRHILFFRYNNGPQQPGPPSAGGPPPPQALMQQQRYGSQTSLQPPSQQQRSQNDVNPQPLYHATPRIVGTPQSSAGGSSGPPQRLVSIGSANLTPTGPEKPQRTYEDNNNKPGRSISQGNPPRGVRFQDPKEDKVRYFHFLIGVYLGVL